MVPGTTVGFLDAVLECRVTKRTADGELIQKRMTFNCEVKSSVGSIGQLLRQINFYRRYIPSDPSIIWVVLAPECGIRSVLRAHGIWFIAAPRNDLDLFGGQPNS